MSEMREVARLTQPIRLTTLHAVMSSLSDRAQVEIEASRPPRLVFLEPVDPAEPSPLS
jgi:hypothetical protein